jgi:hypothetical protein
MKRSRSLLGLAAVLVLAACGTARAAYTPIAHGSTAITFSQQFSATLAKHGVKISVRGGRRHGERLVLQAEDGEIDPRLGTGTVESEGTILLQAGKRKVILRQVTFKAKRAPLYAKVGGGQLKLASGARLTSKRTGFGAEFSATNLRLTAKLASRLNKKLRLGRELHAGQLLAGVAVHTQPSTVHLKPDGRLSLAFDPAFAAKLNQLFVSLNPIAPAELTAGPMLNFPVGLESTLAPDARAGTVKLEGQAELLQLGHAQVFWRELWWEPGAGSLFAETDSEPAPPRPGVEPQAPLLDLQGSGVVNSNPSSRMIDVTGQPVALTPAAAASLNDAFTESGGGVFAAGELVGAVSLHVVAE